MSAFMMFMKEVFGTRFINPKFSASIFLELHKKDKNLKGDLSDYYINYIVNDEFLLRIDFEKFKNEAIKYFWSDYDIEKFCEFKIINVDEKKKIQYFYIEIIITLFFIVVIQIFFLCKIYSKNITNKKEKEIELDDKLLENK